MTEQARTSRVLIGLIVSMTLGAIVLIALDNKGGQVKGGTFQLSVYLRHEPVDKVVFGGLSSRGEWRGIEVYYSQTSGGNARQLALLSGLTGGQDLNAHFVICNGNGGKEGEIERTERWLYQQPCVSSGAWHGSTDTLRICVVADGVSRMPTECQKRRTDDLVKELSRSFKIKGNMVIYPVNWRM